MPLIIHQCERTLSEPLSSKCQTLDKMDSETKVIYQPGSTTDDQKYVTFPRDCFGVILSFHSRLVLSNQLSGTKAAPLLLGNKTLCRAGTEHLLIVFPTELPKSESTCRELPSKSRRSSERATRTPNLGY